MTQADFTLMVCRAVERGDVGFIIRLADKCNQDPAIHSVRDFLNRLTLRMIAANASEVQP